MNRRFFLLGAPSLMAAPVMMPPTSVMPVVTLAVNIQDHISQLLGGAPSALDTLTELSTYMGQHTSTCAAADSGSG